MHSSAKLETTIPRWSVKGILETSRFQINNPKNMPGRILLVYFRVTIFISVLEEGKYHA